jgi:hypothetical protein
MAHFSRHGLAAGTARRNRACCSEVTYGVISLHVTLAGALYHVTAGSKERKAVYLPRLPGRHGLGTPAMDLAAMRPLRMQFEMKVPSSELLPLQPPAPNPAASPAA